MKCQKIFFRFLKKNFLEQPNSADKDGIITWIQLRLKVFGKLNSAL